LLALARRAVVDPDVDAVAAAGALLALELLEVDMIGVRELARDGRTSLARAAVGSWPPGVPRPPTIELRTAPLMALALQSRACVVAERIAGDPRFSPPPSLVAIGVESAAVIPLTGVHGPVGVISALSRSQRRFDRTAVELLEAVAELLGAAFQRRRDEEELRDAEERYRTLVDRAPVCIQGIDRTARIAAINEAGLRMTNLTRQAALGRSYLDLVAPGDRPRVAMLLSQALEGRPSEFDFDSVDGERSFACSFIPLSTPDGEVPGLIGVTQDVTGRRRAEAVLRASEERYRELFENATEAIFICGLDGRITSLNPAAETLVGCTHAEALGNPIAELVSDEAFVQARRLAELSPEHGGGGVTEPLVVRSRAGGRTVVEASACYVRRNGLPVGLQIIARDVSERIRLEAELRQAQKMEALGRLAGGVAHDFNNLVTAIAGYAQLARRSAPAGDERLNGDLEAIVDAAGRAAALTRQLLSFSRRQVVETERLDAARLVRGMEEMLRRLVGEHVSLDLHASDGDCWVDAEPSQLEQILLNLAVNARDAMPSGGRLSISCCPADGERSVRITVADCGTGMDDVVRARLFEPFFTTKGPGKGTGLGLATVYGIVDSYGGSIAVESHLGDGTTFTVDLPRALRAPEELEPGTCAPARPGPRATILLVEDDATVRELARRVLAQAGYAVLEAGGGEEALDICASHDGPIDLVLTDAGLPGLSGADVLRRTGELRPSARRLVMSGNPYDAGVGVATDLLAKPFGPEELVRKVRSVLDERRVGPDRRPAA
jgi:PAS domain S-box-containing protein